MRNVFVLAGLVFLLSSCEKLIEDVQEDLVVNAMTDGQWRVTKFLRDTANVTASFGTYTFQFKKNETVEAINSGAVETTGTWKGNADAKTIVSNFPSGNGTVSLLNGTWNITKNSWTYVEATQTVNNEVRTLRLDK